MREPEPTPIEDWRETVVRPGKSKVLRVRLSNELHEALKAVCRAYDLTPQAYMAQALAVQVNRDEVAIRHALEVMKT